MARWKAVLLVVFNSMILSAALTVFTHDWWEQGYIGLGFIGVAAFNFILILELEMKK